MACICLREAGLNFLQSNVLEPTVWRDMFVAASSFKMVIVSKSQLWEIEVDSVATEYI